MVITSHAAVSAAVLVVMSDRRTGNGAFRPTGTACDCTFLLGRFCKSGRRLCRQRFMFGRCRSRCLVRFAASSQLRTRRSSRESSNGRGAPGARDRGRRDGTRGRPEVARYTGCRASTAGGAIEGTDPLRALLAKERRRALETSALALRHLTHARDCAHPYVVVLMPSPASTFGGKTPAAKPEFGSTTARAVLLIAKSVTWRPSDASLPRTKNPLPAQVAMPLAPRLAEMK